jgi:hypothetical protein
MVLPLATTTVTVLRPTAGADADPYATQPAPATVASGVRAVVSGRSGGGTEVGGQEAVVTATLLCDVADLRHTDRITDAATGETWEVVWPSKVTGFGLDHLKAGIRLTRGQA